MERFLLSFLIDDMFKPMAVTENNVRLKSVQTSSAKLSSARNRTTIMIVLWSSLIVGYSCPAVARYQQFKLLVTPAVPAVGGGH